MQPRRTTISFLDYTIDPAADFNAILISDLHLSKFSELKDAISQLIPKLKQVIELQRPTDIFMLGDIIHHKRPKPDYFYFFKKLELLKIPIHIIPGNHDRRVRDKLEAYKGFYVSYNNCDVLRLLYPDVSNMVCLGHDLFNDKKVHQQHLARQWFKMLRNTFKSILTKNSLLILGHIHQDFHSKDDKTFSIRPFSIDLKEYNYCRLFLDSNREFQHIILSYLSS